MMASSPIIAARRVLRMSSASSSSSSVIASSSSHHHHHHSTASSVVGSILGSYCDHGCSRNSSSRAAHLSTSSISSSSTCCGSAIANLTNSRRSGNGRRNIAAGISRHYRRYPILNGGSVMSSSFSSVAFSSSASVDGSNSSYDGTGVGTSDAGADDGDVRAAVGGGDLTMKDDVVKWKRLSDVPISEVLKAKNSQQWIEPIISRDATIKETIQVCVDNRLSGMMVIDACPTLTIPSTSSSAAKEDTNKTLGLPPKTEEMKVLGMSTSRDLLRIMNSGFAKGEDAEVILGKKVGDFMTPISQVIYARPEETIGMCRTIMAKLGVKCLPILSSGRVEGIITARDMSQFGLEATEKGGKKHYLDSVSERVGMSSSTFMAEPPSYLKAHLEADQKPLYSNVGVAELPHPYKTGDGCGSNRRDFGAGDVTRDNSLSEDAHFTIEVKVPDNLTNNCEPRTVTYTGVADGVGSWREYNVDPREFSHRLMLECENILREASCIKLKNNRESSRVMITPAEVIGQAHERIKADNIVGSSTALVAVIDGGRHQLHFSNLGDCGIILLRHIDSNVAGSLKRETRIPRALRTNDLRVNFVSQQQLRSFNHPHQLGWTGKDVDDVEERLFETSAECCTSSIHIRRGDIIIMATDGLFDNVELEDVTKIALEWEQKNKFITGGGISERAKRWRKGSSMTTESAEAVQDLAQALVERARENSLDNSTDSPFAILAKENDVMWNGGMPDDCTVLVMHIVGAEA